MRWNTKLFLGAAVFLTANPALADLDLSMIFAGCTGRYAAEMEYASRAGNPLAHTYQSQRETFLGLVAATVAPPERVTVLKHRMSAKVSHARLLANAASNNDPDHRKQAEYIARQHLHHCNAMLLQG